MTVGGVSVRYMVLNGELVYINHEGLRPYLPALRANVDGTGAVVQGDRVQYVEDLTGNGNTAIAPTPANGPLMDAEGGLYFDGVDDYLKIAHSPSLDFAGKTQMCIEAWAKSDVVGWAGIWSMVSRYSQFILGPNNKEIAMIVLPDASGWQPLNYGAIDWGQASDPTFDELQWHHYSGVVDTVVGYSKLYVDGILRAEFSIPNIPISADVGDIHIGHRESSAVGSYHQQGHISDVRIWDRVRAQPEISRDMNRRLLGHESGLKAYWPF
jgi:hypothetical protein